jgi:hypothetical protein
MIGHGALPRQAPDCQIRPPEIFIRATDVSVASSHLKFPPTSTLASISLGGCSPALDSFIARQQAAEFAPLTEVYPR